MKGKMTTVADNDRYILKVDDSNNRIYITIKGFWKTKGGYIADLQKACEMVKRGFKIHVDLTEMKPSGTEIGSVHVEAQNLLLKYGLVQTAEVQNDRALLRMAIKQYSDTSGMSKQVFSNHEDAKKWLDAVS